MAIIKAEELCVIEKTPLDSDWYYATYSFGETHVLCADLMRWENGDVVFQYGMLFRDKYGNSIPYISNPSNPLDQDSLSSHISITNFPCRLIRFTIEVEIMDHMDEAVWVLDRESFDTVMEHYGHY